MGVDSWLAPAGSRRHQTLTSFSSTGLTLALIGIWVALSPSLLPRAWWMTAINVGMSATLGYALGALLGWTARTLAPLLGLHIEMHPAARSWLLRAWWTLLAIGTVVSWTRSLDSQAEIARLVGGVPQTLVSQAAGITSGLVLTVLVLALARAIRRVFHHLHALLAARLPPWLLPGLLAAGLVVVGVIGANQVMYRQAMDYLLGRAEQANFAVSPDATRPLEPERSGSPASLEPWDSLGAHGQALVSQGPRAADIAAVTGEPAVEPIRAYAGLVHGRSLEEAADVVVAELHRTGGFDREALLLVTTTGSGWVPEWTMQAVEYLTGGDVATATMQYSYIPSGLAYLTNRAAPAEAGQILFDRVYAAWSALPEGQRPLLLTAGESLGSYGGQAAFTDAADMLSKVDGAVWSGTPRFTPLWRELTQARRPGSPEVAPVVDNGRHIRFVTRPEELVHDYYGGPYEPWGHPRVVYVQHPSDPVVWWSADLLTQHPDWLRESVGRDVSDRVGWIPWVTFWQVASDMPHSGTVPGGSGHNYHEEMVPVWAAVLGAEPGGDYTAIQRAMRAGIDP